MQAWRAPAQSAAKFSATRQRVSLVSWLCALGEAKQSGYEIIVSLGQSVKLRPFGVRSVAAMCLFNSNSYKSDGTPEVLVSSYLQGGVSHVKEHVVYCGIDVAKGQLDGALLGKRWQVPNTKAGIRRLIKMLRQRNTCPQVICEASGGYEQDLVELLHQAAVPVTLVQPQRVQQVRRRNRQRNRLCQPARLRQRPGLEISQKHAIDWC